MRSAVILLLLARSASADVGVGLFAQATRYADRPNRNVGAALELSLDRDRWQYFTELAVAGVSFGNDFAGGLAGTLYRGGLGVRYTARRFSITRSHARSSLVDFELGFEGLAAVQHLEWEAGGRTLRPELAAGFSWTFVLLDEIAFRTSLRAFFTPAPAHAAVCRGPCPADDAITSGYMIVTGVAW